MAVRAGRLLSVDLGNTRCKLRVWEPGRDGSSGRPSLLAGADVESGDGLVARVVERLAALAGERPEAAAVSAVGEAGLAEELRDALARELGVLVLDAPDPGLEVRSAEPARVGRDRLYAARGALVLAGRSAVVVDAGTALTVDAVLAGASGPSGAGAFAGGAIAPGPRLLARALAAGTARLPEVEPRAGAPALGRDTRAAIEGGIAVGLWGAARELARRVAEEAGIPGAPVVLTGGARAFLLVPEPFVEGELAVEEDLVHVGLAAAARAVLEG